MIACKNISVLSKQILKLKSKSKVRLMLRLILKIMLMLRLILKIRLRLKIRLMFENLIVGSSARTGGMEPELADLAKLKIDI